MGRFEYGMIVAGFPRQYACLGGWGWCREGSFSIDWLLPGTYRIRLSGEAEVLSEAEVLVERGEVSEAILDRPKAILIVPVKGSNGGLPENLSVLRAERCSGSEQDSWGGAERWDGYRVTRIPEGLRIEGLPCGLVRVHVVAPGHDAAWSEKVTLVEGSEVTSPEMTLVASRSI